MGPEFDIGPYRLWFVVESCGIACSLAVRTHELALCLRKTKKTLFSLTLDISPPPNHNITGHDCNWSD